VALIGMALAIINLVLALFAAVRGARDIRSGIKHLPWPQTTGEVVGVVVEEPASLGVYFPSGGFRVFAWYRYTVDGEPYSQRLGERSVFSRPGAARVERRIGARFPSGSTLEISYNPSRPELVSLKRGGPTRAQIVRDNVIPVLALLGAASVLGAISFATGNTDGWLA
jgi:hypothetical protein